MLTILKNRPELPGLGGPIALGVVGGLAAVGSLGDGVSSGAILPIAMLLGAGLWGKRRKASGQEAVAAHSAFMERAQAAVAQVNASASLPVESVPLNLQKGEECYWCGAAEWYELRKETRRVDFRGFTVSVPVAANVRYRIGSISPSADRRDVLAHIDSGTLYITNKRLFFDGQGRNSTLKYDALVGVQVFLGGINVERQSGRSPTLLIDSDAEMAAAIIARQLARRDE